MSASQAPAAPALFVGAYGEAGGESVLPLRFDAERDSWSLDGVHAFAGNASFAAFHARTGVHYVVDERRGGRVCALRQDPAGAWVQMDEVGSGGDAPCFVALHPGGAALAVANYASGAAAIIPLSPETGRFAGPPRVISDAGRGPNQERQDGPHVHCTRFHGPWLYFTDLGTDEVRAVPVDGDGHSPGEPFCAWTAPPGQGPRHILFHPRLNRAYLLTELGSRLFVLGHGRDGRLEARQEVSTLPDDFHGASLGGHLAFNAAADRVYVSNRGHDSVAVFRMEDDGRLAPHGVFPVHGHSPRHFRLLEDLGLIIVANEKGDTVTILALAPDGAVGALKQSLAVRRPAFIGLDPPPVGRPQSRR
jgi:6-phosphogluconolactonase